ncbi:hypothetical protein K439DRAFT_1620641 [Ramaria rubella]|nr:hypothetical protein K439DRAFT_1620641 [Ramaria rubella]
MHLQMLDANASEEDNLQADDHQDDRIDDNEEGDELRSADDGEGGVTDLATCRLACNADVPLPLDRLVSPFPLEGHTYVPGTMDDLISVTCHLAQNFASQGWATKEGVSKSQIPLEDVLGVMYGSVDVFSQHTVTWEPVSAEEGDLDHPPGTSRPDVHASATQGVVKLDRVKANHAPGALGKDEALWELVYFFDNMDNPAGTPHKETGDPCFMRQHLVAMFMDLILFMRGLAAPQAHLPSRAYEALAPSLMVPRPAQFFQGIAEQGYMWQNVPYGIDFTRDICVYGRSGTFRSWGKAQRGVWFVALCYDDPDRRLGLVCVCVGHPVLTQEFLAFSRFVCVLPVKECLCLCHLGRADNHFRSKMIDPTLFQLFWAARFPTCAGLAADPGIQVYVTDPQPPSPACTTAGEAHTSPRSAMEFSEPQSASTPSRPPHTPLGAGRSPVLSRPSIGMSTPQRRDHTAPPPHQQALPQPGALHVTPHHCGCLLRPTWGQTCVVELPPLRHAQSLLLARCLSKRACSASGGPPGEDAQAVCSTCHTLGGLIPGGMRVCGCLLAWDAGATPRFPWGCRPLVFARGSDVARPMGFRPPGRQRPALAAPVGVRPDIVGSDHRGAIVNMYLELSRTEWWALSDQREVLSE